MTPQPGTGSRRANITSPGDERSTLVLSGEITRDLGQPHLFEDEAATREAPARIWPRTDSPQFPVEEFGTYYVYEELGVGGMATVHRAERRVGGARQRVALKRLLPNAVTDPDLLKLFLDEGKLVSRLRHRNIAEAYDCGEVGGEYFLAMELVAGPTLKALLKKCAATVGLIPYPIALNLLTQVCEALAYAHELVDETGKRLGVVHRDVSPSNIVISTNGVVKLIDFGVAKTTTTNTQAGIIKGKLAYIAPEYLEGGIDLRADLWAVGACAYELLTNKRLFTGDDDLELMRQVRSQPISPPSRINPDVPPELDAVVMTALSRDPDQRWQNATALRTALAGVGRPSTNAELVEWVEWVYKLGEGAPRPVRGTRSHAAMTTAQVEAAVGAQPAPEPVQWIAEASTLSPVEWIREDPTPPAAGKQSPVAGKPAPVRAPSPVHWVAAAPLDDTVPVPPPLGMPLHLPLPAPRHTTLLPSAARHPRRYLPTIGAAMVARRRKRSFLVPVVLFVLGGAASAFAVPRLFESLLGG